MRLQLIDIPTFGRIISVPLARHVVPYSPIRPRQLLNMPLPEFRPDGWLPDGHHDATWEEIESRFGGNPGSPRRTVYDRLVLWRDSARQVGLSGTLVLDGSFVSAKEEPGDFDTVFVYDDECEDTLASDPAAMELVSYDRNKVAGDDLFVFAKQSTIDSPQWASIDLFDKDTRTGVTKGVLEVQL